MITLTELEAKTRAALIDTGPGTLITGNNPVHKEYFEAATPKNLIALIADLRQARALMRMAADELNNIHAHFKAGHMMAWDSSWAIHDELLSALDSMWVKP